LRVLYGYFLHKQQMRASLLLLNWKRPANVSRILAVEQSYRQVAEILVFNNNGAEPFHHAHPKVKILNASVDCGLRARWLLAVLAQSDCLIFQDDDILLPESTISGFINEVRRDRQRVYGLHGRNPGPDGRYSTAAAYGEVEIVLTRAAAIHRTLVSSILASEQAFREAGFAIPAINGEDIFLSYCIFAQLGKKHRVLRLPFADLPSLHGLSARPEHVKERTQIVRQCKRFFLGGKHPVITLCPTSGSTSACPRTTTD
jgi:Glycosyl transferase family 64 domain